MIIDRGQRAGQIGHVHFGQEAELAEVHPENGGALPVSQPHGAQHGAVATETDQQVGAPGQFLGRNRLGGAGYPLHLRVDAEDLYPPAHGPVQNRADRPAAVAFGVQNQAHDVHLSRNPSLGDWW